MSDKPVLTAQVRTEFGKGAARRARRAGLVPAVVYGAGTELVHLDVPQHDLFLIVRGTRGGQQVELTVDGSSYDVVVGEIQRHPVSRELLHVDFVVATA
ncbi:50S ribosomal protein L25 [Actinomyces sp. B33]|uniref:50S ribosomal protein L25 n=1 Tax=Actinomyces sp. B33 TaxID=2942131 RepID=UPI003FA41584